MVENDVDLIAFKKSDKKERRRDGESKKEKRFD